MFTVNQLIEILLPKAHEGDMDAIQKVEKLKKFKIDNEFVGNCLVKNYKDFLPIDKKQEEI